MSKNPPKNQTESSNEKDHRDPNNTPLNKTYLFIKPARVKEILKGVYEAEETGETSSRIRNSDDLETFQALLDHARINASRFIANNKNSEIQSAKELAEELHKYYFEGNPTATGKAFDAMNQDAINSSRCFKRSIIGTILLLTGIVVYYCINPSHPEKTQDITHNTSEAINDVLGIDTYIDTDIDGDTDANTDEEIYTEGTL